MGSSVWVVLRAREGGKGAHPRRSSARPCVRRGAGPGKRVRTTGQEGPLDPRPPPGTTGVHRFEGGSALRRDLPPGLAEVFQTMVMDRAWFGIQPVPSRWGRGCSGDEPGRRGSSGLSGSACLPERRGPGRRSFLGGHPVRPDEPSSRLKGDIDGGDLAAARTGGQMKTFPCGERDEREPARWTGNGNRGSWQRNQVFMARPTCGSTRTSLGGPGPFPH
jgi:hypothetical protein